jgi:DNA-3-methyladenine glycosylase II
VRSWYGYHQVKFLTPFENACWAILSQRNPMPVARKMKQALVVKVGNRINVNGDVHWAFPEPNQVASLSVDELSSLIHNQRKAQCLSAVAQAFSEVDETFLRTADYDEVNAWLQSIKGIGEWSAAFVLIRGLGRMERLSITEKRLLESASKIYGQGRTLSKTDVQHIAQRYDPYPAYWAHYLRVAS